ncbi:phosphopantetheine-binding protein [Xenophilus arseniciresistens]|uniref:Phosphopantetheine-binding protein n=1 Tax=Xenophilus arseniciresistens TaxID=1283306 RepID=A0AAE3T0T7_9BURK|nr:phosphopantetheine-binding protein [Xenophilus arseniciresistens]MDA7416647.1 phosphopantetheine-binding protein [Xenophilus arseniciresistens]
MTDPTSSAPVLTLEKLRADVARMVGEAPEDIALDDNLMDVGLDSMRMLNLIMGWNEAGLKIDFSDLAEHTTLEGWWKVLCARQSL